MRIVSIFLVVLFTSTCSSEPFVHQDNIYNGLPKATNLSSKATSLVSSWAYRCGIGFTLDPGEFLMSFEGYRPLYKKLNIGPLLQIGVSDHRAIVAPSINLQYMFDLSPEKYPPFNRLKPFIQGGIGFAYMHRDHKYHGDDDDAGLLLNLGPGIEYQISENFSVGSNMLFNVLPVEVTGKRFFFSWQFVTATFRF